MNNIPQTITIPTMYFIDIDDKPQYDFEGMADFFQQELSKLDDSLKIIVSVYFKN
jgi:hypothetical protein